MKKLRQWFWLAVLPIALLVKGLYYLSGAVVVFFFVWLAGAVLVDLVSDANVEYEFPVIGLLASLFVHFLCWGALHGVVGAAQNSRVKSLMRGEYDD